VGVALIAAAAGALIASPAAEAASPFVLRMRDDSTR
jgi:hypothetical protein